MRVCGTTALACHRFRSRTGARRAHFGVTGAANGRTGFGGRSARLAAQGRRIEEVNDQVDVMAIFAETKAEPYPKDAA
jgi:hypothetical protein